MIKIILIRYFFSRTIPYLVAYVVLKNSIQDESNNYGTSILRAERELLQNLSLPLLLKSLVAAANNHLFSTCIKLANFPTINLNNSSRNRTFLRNRLFSRNGPFSRNSLYSRNRPFLKLKIAASSV